MSRHGDLVADTARNGTSTKVFHRVSVSKDDLVLQSSHSMVDDSLSAALIRLPAEHYP